MQKLILVLVNNADVCVRDVTEPVKIRICRILYYKSIRFGFVTQPQRVQFS